MTDLGYKAELSVPKILFAWCSAFGPKQTLGSQHLKRSRPDSGGDHFDFISSCWKYEKHAVAGENGALREIPRKDLLE